jgi:hypothetical protein
MRILFVTDLHGSQSSRGKGTRRNPHGCASRPVFSSQLSTLRSADEVENGNEGCQGRAAVLWLLQLSGLSRDCEDRVEDDFGIVGTASADLEALQKASLKIWMTGAQCENT